MAFTSVALRLLRPLRCVGWMEAPLYTQQLRGKNKLRSDKTQSAGFRMVVSMVIDARRCTTQ